MSRHRRPLLAPHALLLMMLATPFAACAPAEVDEATFSEEVAALVCGEAFSCDRCHSSATLFIEEPYTDAGLFGGATSVEACESMVAGEMLARLYEAGADDDYDGLAAAECVEQMVIVVDAAPGCRCHVEADMRQAVACSRVASQSSL